MTEPALICKHAPCGKEIVPGEGWHTVAQMHWRCYEEAFPPLDELFKQLDRKAYGENYTPAKKRKRPCRPGDGPTAKRLKKLLVPLLKQAIEEQWQVGASGITETSIEFWVQAPTHRGPRWDLACWGAIIEHTSIPTGKALLHSWSTMSQLIRHRATLALRLDSPLEWDVICGAKSRDD